MKLIDGELKELYQSETARKPGNVKACPSAEELARAAGGEKGADERVLTDHLMACSDCAEEYRILTSVKQWADSLPALAEGVSSSPGLASVQQEKSRASRRAWRDRLGAAFSPNWAYAIAALLLVVSSAVVVWIVTQRRGDQRVIARLDKEIALRDQRLAATQESLDEARRQVEEANRRQSSNEQAKTYQAQIVELQNNLDELSRPQLNAPIIDLEPQGSVRGSSQSPKVVDVPSTASLFTLILNVSGQQNYSMFALEIVDQPGKVVWHGNGLVRSPDNTFTVALPRRLLQAGEYHLKLFGLAAGERKLVEDYAVQVRYK